MDHTPTRSLTHSTLLLALLFFSGPIQGASTLNFPRLSFETATLTGLAIVNPNDQTADITLTAFNADGGLLPGVNSVGAPLKPTRSWRSWSRTSSRAARTRPPWAGFR